MSHRSALSDVRRIAAVLFAVLLALSFTAAVTAGGADAKKSKKAKVSMKVKTKNQAQLLKQKKLTVKVKSTGKTKVKVKARHFKSKKVKFKKRGTKTIKLKLTGKGTSKLSLCGAKTVKVQGKYGKKKAKARKKLAKDKSRCITVPLGSDPENCDFLDTTVCLQPFANDYYTKDADTPTGKQLNIAADATPANRSGVHIDPTDQNRGDGFSPGNMIVLKIPGLETPAAFDNSGLVPLSDLHAYDDPNQSVIVFDAATGERHPIWAELDSNPTTVDPEFGPDGPDPGNDPDVISPGGINQNPGNTADVNLMLRPAENFEHGKRYIVVFRNLKNANNKTIKAPPAFRTYRDKVITKQNIVEKRRPHMNSVINTAVKKAGVKRSSMYMAWDFTVASAESTTGRALEIRDDAFARLGDNNLANRVIEGASPEIQIDYVCDRYKGVDAGCRGGPGGPSPDIRPTLPGADMIRVIDGRLKNVPCYLNADGCGSGATFDHAADGSITWNPSYTMDTTFRCFIPTAIQPGGNGTAVTPGQTGTYGHGLLGAYTQTTSSGPRAIANEAGSVWCGIDWAGFSESDLSSVGLSLADMSHFPKMVDRMQQGFVNFMYLQRALAHPGGFADEPAMKLDNGSGDVSVIDTSMGMNTRGQYMGISQGGIMGGALVPLSPDVDYGVLGVPGMNYSTLLRRSVDSDEYFKNPAIGLYPNYPDERERPMLLAMIQLLWDRGEANGYAHFMSDEPLPNTPPHEVLMRAAYSDHQVSNYTAETMARTIDANIYSPTLNAGRHWDVDPYMGLNEVTAFPHKGGSMLTYYDSGPVEFTGTRGIGVKPPPIENVPPRPEWGFGRDPHGDPRVSDDGVKQGASFLSNGTVVGCGSGTFCYANGWTGP